MDPTLKLALLAAAVWVASDVCSEAWRLTELRWRFGDAFADQGLSLGPPARVHIAFCNN
jgi:hypothetical protein